MKFVYIFIACMFIMSSSFGIDGKTLYKKCRGCHGIDGKQIPFERPQGVLAGKNKDEIALLINILKDTTYTGDKLNKIMSKIIKEFSDEDIAKISEYIGTFKK